MRMCIIYKCIEIRKEEMKYYREFCMRILK